MASGRVRIDSPSMILRSKADPIKVSVESCVWLIRGYESFRSGFELLNGKECGGCEAGGGGGMMVSLLSGRNLLFNTRWVRMGLAELNSAVRCNSGRLEIRNFNGNVHCCRAFEMELRMLT